MHVIWPCGGVRPREMRVEGHGSPIAINKGFIAEQPGNVTVYSAVAREFNTKAEQPGITAGR